jgi:hypothetical protein
MVEGYHRTGDKKKYFARLFVTGLIAELPFLYTSTAGRMKIIDAVKAEYGDVTVTYEVFDKFVGSLGDAQAQYFKGLYNSTARYAVDGLVTLAISLLMVWAIDNVRKKYLETQRAKYFTFTTLILIGFLAVIIMLPLENPLQIAFFSAAFFYMRGNRPGISIISLLLIMSFYSEEGLMMQSGAILGVLFVLAYNGKPGEKKYKWAFYAAYPLQFLIFALIGNVF